MTGNFGNSRLDLQLSKLHCVPVQSMGQHERRDLLQLNV